MFSLLLAIIYIAFISLGLPDSLLGSGWTTMSAEIGVPISYAGIISMIIAGGTIISSLMSDRLTKRMGAGLVTAVSVLMTAAAMFGFSVAGSFWTLCLLAIPYGLGAGAIDAALNNYVANHYASRHMSWLHCFWGVGASISPYIMGYSLARTGWRNGYGTVALIQMIFTTVMFLSLPLWKDKKNIIKKQTDTQVLGLRGVLRISGVGYVLFAFFAYCAMEATAGLWAASFLELWKGADKAAAANFASFFYLGITFGRFLSGFVTDKIGDRGMIRIGAAIILIGITAMLLPTEAVEISLAGLLVIGFGCAPVYPAIIHATPANFGRENSQAVIGVQMASAYVGSTFMPPLFGLIAENINIGLYPAYLLIFAVILLIMTEILNKKVRNFI